MSSFTEVNVSFSEVLRVLLAKGGECLLECTIAKEDVGVWMLIMGGAVNVVIVVASTQTQSGRLAGPYFFICAYLFLARC